MLNFLLCLLMAAGFITEASHAAQTSIYQQRVEAAQPDQEALAHSAKLLKEHQDIKLQEKLLIPSFHKQSGELETAPQTFCRNCHSPLPHSRQLRNRAFNNMHVRFIACETCHFRPKNLNFDYLWFDYAKDQTVNGAQLFRIGRELDNATQRPSNPKIAPLYQGQRAFALKDDKFAQLLMQQWEQPDSNKALLRAKIHWPLEKKGPACHDCHNADNSLLDLKALGASPEQAQAIGRHTIPQFFKRYEKDEQKITIRNLLQ